MFEDEFAVIFPGGPNPKKLPQNVHLGLSNQWLQTNPIVSMGSLLVARFQSETPSYPDYPLSMHKNRQLVTNIERVRTLSRSAQIGSCQQVAPCDPSINECSANQFTLLFLFCPSLPTWGGGNHASELQLHTPSHFKTNVWFILAQEIHYVISSLMATLQMWYL